MNNSSRRPLENYGDTCRCKNPQCRAWVYRNTLRNGKCIRCNLPPKREPTLEELIEVLAAKLEGAKQ